ncbi:MAG: hypothetical protein Q9221_004696 [Calogaya cf. arnoldii]
MSGRPRGGARQGDRPVGNPRHGNAGHGRGKNTLNPDYDDKFSGQAIFAPHGERLQPPDKAVEQKEDQLIRTAKRTGMSLNGLSIPARPSYGTNGKQVVLWTNYFPLLAESKRQIFRYTIDISPTIDSNRRKTRRLIELLQANNKEHFELAEVATDFANIFITSKKLRIPDGGISLRQRYDEAEEEYTVTIKPETPISIEQLLESISRPAGITLNGFEKSASIQALNIIMTQTAKDTAGIYGGGNCNKFYSWPGANDPTFRLGQGLIALQGFHTSVRSSTSRLLVNINVANAAFYPAINLHALMDEYTSNYAHSGLETFISRLKVSHKFYGKKTVKTVKGFSHARHDKNHDQPRFGDAHTIKFKCDEERIKGMVSDFEHFKKKYNIPINYPKVPCINVGSDQRQVFIPPELLTIEPGKQYNKKLSADQTAEMLNFAVRKPAENARRIVGEGTSMMRLSDANPKLVQYKVGKNFTFKTPRDASWNMRDVQFSDAKKLQPLDWGYVKLGPKFYEFGKEDIARFMNFAKAAGLDWSESEMAPNGIKPANPLQLPYDGPNTRETNDAIIERIMLTASKYKLKILFVILPDNNAFLYSRVKFHGEVRYGKHRFQSQSRMTLKLCRQLLEGKKGAADYAANIAHKFNLKLGGANQTLTKDKLGIFGDGKTMLVGMDWPGSIRLQAHSEMIDKLEEMFGERLDLWYAKHKNLPDRIIIYRDGVSEGQYETLLENELPKVEAACKALYRKWSPAKYPKIAVIVCRKRHHTRFYPTDIEDADGTEQQNCRSGTVVDRGITMEHGWDFFLQAHHCLQGTAKPTHYVVIRNDIKMDANELEAFTHHLCYLSARSTKAISLCPPAYFADLLCERGRMYLYKVYNAAHFYDRNAALRYDPNTAPVDGNGNFDWNRSPWTGLIHDRVKDSMFYI